MINLDFGSGYNPKESYFTCDFTSNPSLDFYCLDNTIYNKDLSLCSSNTFDKILCRNVLHHIPNLKVVILELYRVLKCGGELLIIEPNRKFFNQNVFLDTLWYRGINKREDIWFSMEYRDYSDILIKLFSQIQHRLEGEKEFFTCFKKESLDGTDQDGT